jgi:hypothetical protein
LAGDAGSDPTHITSAKSEAFGMFGFGMEYEGAAFWLPLVW